MAKEKIQVPTDKDRLAEAIKVVDLSEETVKTIAMMILSQAKHELAEEETKEHSQINGKKVHVLQNFTWTRW